MKINQKRAIAYAIQRKKEEKANKIVKMLKEDGIKIIESKYPEVTIRRAKKALIKEIRENAKKNKN